MQELVGLFDEEGKRIKMNRRYLDTLTVQGVLDFFETRKLIWLLNPSKSKAQIYLSKPLAKLFTGFYS
jgi:hypothetical protein